MSDPSDQQLFIELWIDRAIHLIALCVASYILYRKESKENKIEPKINTNIYQKMLNLSCRLTLTTFIIMNFSWLIGLIFSSLCYYGVLLGITCWGASRLFLTFYQTARLQYCFLDKQIHSKKYGYPQCLFYILYIFGSILLLWYSAISWFLYDGNENNYYCYLEPNEFGIIQSFGIMFAHS